MADPVFTTRAQQYGARLRAEAERQGMNARALAEALDVSESAVSRWFAGAREIGYDRRVAAAALLGVSYYALFPTMTADGVPVA